jgi:predicted lipid-binding transport protein (Tim44 family)
MSTPGRNPVTGAPTQPSGGLFGGSPFMQGLAGGLAGGFLGSLLFGGVGHATPGGATGGGMGLLDLILIGALLYFGYRFLKRRRAQVVTPGTGFGGSTGFSRPMDDNQPLSYTRTPQPGVIPGAGEVEQGLRQIRQFDGGLSEEALKETLQDIFFRVQAGWMNRSVEGIEGMITDEMAQYLRNEFDAMRRAGTINRLENIAVRKVEISEAWQEVGKDYVTVLFTANLLDYTVNDSTGAVVEGDKSNPVKFQEFWTFCRDVGPNPWRLSAINQVSDAYGAAN